MNKSYLIGPLAALVVFIGVYVNFQSGYKAKVEAKDEQRKAVRVAKLKAEVDARKVAIDEALKSQELRKKEREAKEAKDKLEKEARQAALEARDKAYREQDKLTRQIERLKKDLAAEKELFAKVAELKKAGKAEQVFLKDFVAKAEANSKALEDVLNKIAAAETARAAAEAAAIAAKKT